MPNLTQNFLLAVRYSLRLPFPSHRDRKYCSQSMIRCLPARWLEYIVCSEHPFANVKNGDNTTYEGQSKKEIICESYVHQASPLHAYRIQVPRVLEKHSCFKESREQWPLPAWQVPKPVPSAGCSARETRSYAQVWLPPLLWFPHEDQVYHGKLVRQQKTEPGVVTLEISVFLPK